MLDEKDAYKLDSFVSSPSPTIHTMSTHSANWRPPSPSASPTVSASTSDGCAFSFAFLSFFIYFSFSFFSFFSLSFSSFFETGSHPLTQVGLNLMAILLLQLPKS